ncbi:putative cysteine peptidase [Mesoplasma seiffertii]|uniref:putative cysteine peptidase n=1 Tax=Mesoplasma seiffertii TaxID=28224 RepID=UPI000683DA46|nr:hypothetical protein [Mesoplasma seiffertii]
MINVDTENISEEQISKFSLLPNNWQFFTKLDSKNKIGYYAIGDVLFSKESNASDIVSDENKSKYHIGPDDGGLCEYVSLVMLYKYFHIYGKNNYFTQQQIKKYFRNGKLDQDNFEHVEPTRMENGEVISTAYDLWVANNRRFNLWYGSDLRRTTRNFVGNWVKDDYSVSWMHTSRPEQWIEKYKVPVIVVSGNYEHSFLIYGYDKVSNKYAVHLGWEDKHMKTIPALKLFSLLSLGYWYGIHE